MVMPQQANVLVRGTHIHVCGYRKRRLMHSMGNCWSIIINKRLARTTCKTAIHRNFGCIFALQIFSVTSNTAMMKCMRAIFGQCLPWLQEHKSEAPQPNPAPPTPREGKAQPGNIAEAKHDQEADRMRAPVWTQSSLEPLDQQDAHAQGSCERMEAQKNLKAAEKRATQRFTSFVTATRSRLADEREMRRFLGESNWFEFCKFSSSRWRQKWKKRFRSEMKCCGTLKGKPCPYKYGAAPSTQAGLQTLSGLHLDHRIEVAEICKAWKLAVGVSPKTWHEGIDKELLCHLLFGIEEHPRYLSTKNDLWKPNLFFRCGNRNDRRRQNGQVFCHDTFSRHSEWRLSPDDLKLQHISERKL